MLLTISLVDLLPFLSDTKSIADGCHRSDRYGAFSPAVSHCKLQQPQSDMGRDAARYAKFLRTYRTTVANLGISLLKFTDILIYSDYKIS